VARKWIAEATSKNRGAFGRQAKSAGKSTAGYEGEVLAKGSRVSARTKKRARMSRTLRMLRERKAA